MTDLLGSANLQTSANAQTDHGSVGYDGSTDATAHASEGGADLGGMTQHGLTYDTEHASGSADLGGALDAAGSTDGVDVAGALEGAASAVTEHGSADVGGRLAGDAAASADGADASVTGGFDAVLDAMEDLWASVSGSLSAALGL